MSFSPQFVSYLRLVSQLDGVSEQSYYDILMPNIVSWMLLFMSSLIIYVGLHKKEDLREGADPAAHWALHERHIAGTVLEAEQASVNYMTDDQVSHAAQELAMGKGLGLNFRASSAQKVDSGVGF
eukprot:3402799-Pyramimonas_sp.AAC.1